MIIPGKKQQDGVMHYKKTTLFGLLSPSLFHLTKTSIRLGGRKVQIQLYRHNGGLRKKTMKKSLGILHDFKIKR